MESTIYRTVLGSEIEKMFDARNDINIRFYQTDVPNSDYSPHEKYKFQILIRHSENTNANELFDKVYCEMFLPKDQSL
jgi:hypothetical protein